MKYKIQENQTAIDVVNQLYTTVDDISRLMLDNVEFDINLMNQDLEVRFDEPYNAIRNDINLNNLTFVNNNNVVYEVFDELSLPIGVYSDIELVGTYCYVVETKEFKWLTTLDYEIRLTKPSKVLIFSESF